MADPRISRPLIEFQGFQPFNIAFDLFNSVHYIKKIHMFQFLTKQSLSKRLITAQYVWEIYLGSMEIFGIVDPRISRPPTIN